ncbi:MAG: hypothetical protein K1X88_12165 [Nannocystaceae bacterium]|nr:hypothetical protein [Nannocystaceae bacterium]
MIAGLGANHHAVPSFLFSLLFAAMGFFFLFVAACAGYGLFRVLRSSARDRKYLEGAREESPLRLDHLGHALRSLAMDTRSLRISLEAPVRDIAELRQGQLNATAEDLDSFDTMLMNVSRAIADWLVHVDRLSELDQATLADLGANAEPIRNALAAEGYAFERRHIMRSGGPPLDERLRAIIDQLDKFELALQAGQRVYR